MGSQGFPDLTYYCHDGTWTRFYAETPAGEEAYAAMAKADDDGVVAYLKFQVPGVLAQLRKAGYRVFKGRRPKAMNGDDLEAALCEIDELLP